MGRSLAEENEVFLDLISKLGNVLLIYDSSDDLDVIDDLLPQSNTKVHVIVTTRCRDHMLMNEGHVISLPPLEEDAAVEAFLSWAGMNKDTNRVSESERKAARDIVNNVQVKGTAIGRSTFCNIHEGNPYDMYTIDFKASGEATIAILT